MRDLLHDNGDAQIVDLCRRYVAMDQESREAWRATIDTDLAFKLVSFAARTGQSLTGRTPSDVEVALLAAGLAYRTWDDERDVMAAVDELRRVVEGYGEAPHIFVERVAPVLPTSASSLLRKRFGRRLHKMRFVEESSEIPQHEVLDTLLHRPRLAYLLVWAIEASLQLHVGRNELRSLFRAVWLEQLPGSSLVLATNKQGTKFSVQFDRYQGEIRVRFESEPPTAKWRRWIQQAPRRKASERFRAVIEAFTAAFTPIASINVDRMAIFRRSTQHLFEWKRNRPILKSS